MSALIIVACPDCGAKLRLGDRSKFGRKVACARCQLRFIAEDPQPAVVIQPILSTNVDDLPASEISTAIPGPKSPVQMATEDSAKPETKPASKKVPVVSWKNPEEWAVVSLDGISEPKSFQLPAAQREQIDRPNFSWASAICWLVLLGGAAASGFYAYSNPTQVQLWQNQLQAALPAQLRWSTVSPVVPAGNQTAVIPADPANANISQEKLPANGMESSANETTPEPPVRQIPEGDDAPATLLTSPRHASSR